MVGHAFARAELDALRAAGRLRSMRSFEGAPEPATRMDGREVLQFSSNNYLGLATHPEVVQAAQEAAVRWGTGSGGSRLLSGALRVHRELEAELADLKGTEDAVLYGSGYQANLGALAALAGRGDRIASDALNHASVVDGCRLSRADVEVYAHADADAARHALAGATVRRRILATDGVFSMDGDEAPLRSLAEVARDADALLYVDDAHGTGVLGGGRGTAHEHGVAADVDLHMGTLSKALGSSGGFVASSRVLCDLLRNTSRAFIFSTAPAPPTVGAALAAVRLLRREPHRVRRLLENAHRVRDGLRRQGWSVPAGRTPIVPLVVGSESAALSLMRSLEEAGVYAGAVRPPTVPPGQCRVRITAMATHEPRHIESLLEACRRARETLEVAPSPASS